ncbi:unnamed protein product [Euphydryas editha]|uniref:Transposase n=1 Tax=Euphydryas editha TaxID=104508 RepID=A0AAU9TTD8_EUPED|nr:unnamed protein product [Euphydryas editha]
MRGDEKLCTLMFDEMAITPHFDYNRKKDKITRFVNYEGNSIRKIADHVLVFMIRGIVKNSKQPIHYAFCTPKEILACLIKNIIQELNRRGFIVLALVCDQGTSNTSAINYLIEETRVDYLKRNEILKHSVFEVEGKCVIPLYDVPHLLKGLRNNLITKNLKYTMDGQEKLAKWEHIKTLYENSPTYKGLKLIKKLTENHCNKDKIPKMKVKYASQLFSQTVGKTMGYLAENGTLSEDAKDTADLIIFVDNLFDSMNGSFKNCKTRSGKELLKNVTPNSVHKNVWTHSKKILKSMKFVSITGSAGTVSSINNWLHTIENMEILRDKLFYKHNIKSLWCRHLNQEARSNREFLWQYT